MKFYTFTILSAILLALAVNFSRAEFEMSKPELKNIAEQVCSEQDVPKDKCKESFEDVAKNTEKCLSYEFYKKLKAVDGSKNNCQVDSSVFEMSSDDKADLLMCNAQYGHEKKCELCAETSECMGMRLKEKKEEKEKQQKQ